MTARIARYQSCAVAVAVACLLTAACGSGPERPLAAPFAPTFPEAVPGPPVEYWSLDHTLASVTGAETCGWDGVLVGETTSRPLTVHREDARVSFVYGDEVDQLSLAGTLGGEAFTAGADVPLRLPCHGQGRDLILESRADGRFSADGRALTATEIITYRFVSGEVIVFTFDWAASRR
jgi:hypothetical protein